jgi:coenzyme F420-reducing hydrogenase alpha subunit
MPRQILIDPVTRIEGHSKITIQLDDQGAVQDAQFHVTQFRGFEKFCEGRPFTEMPSLTARTCGICPVSHLMASAKACDALLAVEIPPTAAKLRRLMNLAQIVQSHALSFFHLSSPDLLFGMDGDPAKRNIFGVVEAHPSLAKDGIALRKFGQEIVALLGGKRIQPAWAVPGGVSEPLSEQKREKILAMIPEAYVLIDRTLSWYKSVQERYRDEIRTFGNFPSMFMALVTHRLENQHDALSSFHQHYARLVEILYGIERIEQILNEPDILDKHVRAFAQPNKFEGIGVAEAPRGTLIHHYKIDENGLITWVNMIIATGHNSLAMNRSVRQVAQHYVKGARLQEGMLNRVEAVIRCYDPCLSCSTHAIGRMPLHIQLLGYDGEVLDEAKRN